MIHLTLNIQNIFINNIHYHIINNLFEDCYYNFNYYFHCPDRSFIGYYSNFTSHFHYSFYYSLYFNYNFIVHYKRLRIIITTMVILVIIDHYANLLIDNFKNH